LWRSSRKRTLRAQAQAPKLVKLLKLLKLLKLAMRRRASRKKLYPRCRSLKLEVCMPVNGTIK
jgi:hypothetical protein